MEVITNARQFVNNHHEKISVAFKVSLLLGYLVYFGFAVFHKFGDEESIRLVVVTTFGIFLIVWNAFKRTRFYKSWDMFVEKLLDEYSKGKRSLIVRWFLYVSMTLFLVVYVIVFVALRKPENLRSLMGLVAFPFMLWLTSNNRCKVNWHTVYWAMTLQFLMALIIYKTTWGAALIQWWGSRLTDLIDNARAGSVFMFGKTYTDHRFVMANVPQMLLLIVSLSVLTYLGVIRFVVETLGRALAFCLGTSPAEGINTIGNIFLHVPESAMLIQEYIADMTPSQLFVTYASGLSTVGGSALIIFMSSGVPAAPLIAASTMSAPAALAASKLSFPSHSGEVVPVSTGNENERSNGRMRLLEKPTSLIHSLIVGINQSVVLICQFMFFIMTFIVLLEWANNTLIWFGERIGVENMTAEFLFAYLFYPFAFLMGVPSSDCLFVAELLGIRQFSMAVIAFPKLGPIMVNGRAFRVYVAGGVNNTWSYVGSDIVLDNLNQTLTGGVIDPRSEIIATYALCGSASFAIMGLIIGSFEAIVPNRIGEITHNIVRAMVVGTFASYLTACFAGLLFEEDI